MPLIWAIILGMGAYKALQMLPSRESILAGKKQHLAERTQLSQELARKILAAREKGEQHSAAAQPLHDRGGFSQLINAVARSSDFGDAGDDGTGQSVEDSPPLRAASEGTSAVGAVDSGDLDVEGILSAISSLTTDDAHTQVNDNGLLAQLRRRGQHA